MQKMFEQPIFILNILIIMLKALIALYGIKKRMSIHIRIRETHLNHQPNKGMTFNEREPAFSGGLKNFFISPSSQKKTKEVRMLVMMIISAQMCGSSLSISTKFLTTPRTKHPVPKSVQIIEGIHYNLDDQDIEAKILLTIMKTSKYGTDCLGRNSE